jgi:hypothetical protein
MGELVKIDPELIALIRRSFNGENLPMPFVREIFLIETHIAGTSHVDIEDIEPGLGIGDCLVFIREPENEHDKMAIKIHDSKGNKLGYVPRVNNEILANLLDAGKLVFGKLEQKAWLGDWLKVTIKVYLRD